MHRIDTSTAQVDKFGAGKNGFTGGNPQTGELPTALDADFFDSVQEEIAGLIESAGLSLNKTKNNQLSEAIKNLVGNGRLINVQIFTVSGKYTPTPGTTSVVVEVQGAGGGSGGIGSAGGSTVSMGNGGSGGGYAKSRLSTGFTGGIQITVGLGGSGGNLAPTNGSDGGLSSFGSLIVANGGRGGISQAQVAPTFSATGSLGGVATGGNLLNIRGGPSSNGACLSTTSVLPGNGGGSQLGTGGLSPANNTTTVYGGEGYGGGGGGGYAFNRSGNSGSPGASGVVIIWEYA
ncbi:hypothetical protein BSU01_01260 [Erwinia billingiae]|uniref:glycine-rich domain-containing protein n=1 Tax=Erwinia billingiae TaxID=182337 RepID=UPI0019D2CC6B|nr:carbohydrate kinase [Erwinia billingiae]MBN7120347.1 hypothetical protein [Erwinia billingiae]